MFGWITTLFHWLNRRTDMQILWPAICDSANGDPDMARAAMMFHISNDRAWTDHFTHAELVAFVDGLTRGGEHA